MLGVVLLRSTGKSIAQENRSTRKKYNIIQTQCRFQMNNRSLIFTLFCTVVSESIERGHRGAHIKINQPDLRVNRNSSSQEEAWW